MRTTSTELRYALRDESLTDAAFARYRDTGDPNAFAAVVRETAAPLLRAARSFTKCTAVADDLVQATLVAAILGREHYDPQRPVVPWLLGILDHRARRHKRDALRELDPLRLRRETPAPDPRDAAVARELADRIEHAIASLPKTYRAVVDLNVRLGLTPREIAQALGRTRSTVRTQLARGLARVRETLEQPSRSVAS